MNGKECNIYTHIHKKCIYKIIFQTRYKSYAIKLCIRFITLAPGLWCSQESGYSCTVTVYANHVIWISVQPSQIFHTLCSFHLIRLCLMFLGWFFFFVLSICCWPSLSLFFSRYFSLILSREIIVCWYLSSIF